MITDSIDVEPLLGRHDPGMIFVGPLLGLSKSSSYRYFYIAGTGSKVYETIGLGFIEVEKNAQTQRADFIKKLKRRFAKVLTFGSHLEMAHAVHTRWSNEETAKFLAFAELEAKPKSSKVTVQHQSIDDNGSHGSAVPDDYGKKLVDAVAPEPVGHTKDIDAISADAPPLALDQAQPMPVSRPAHTLMPSRRLVATLRQPLRGDRAGTEQQRHAGLSQDDIASAILRLKPPAELGGVPRHAVEGARSLASIMLRFCAVGCAIALVAALVAWAAVRPSTWQVAGEIAPVPVSALSISVSRNQDPSQAAAAVPPSPPNRLAEGYEAAVRAEPGPTTVPPSPSQPAQVASVQAGAAPISGPQSLPAQGGSTARRRDAEETATLANRGMASVKRGDLDLSQAAAAAPASVPNQPMKTNEPTPQAEPAPATAPPSPPSQPAHVASIQAGVASGPQSLPTQGGSTARHLDAGEIATLVNRGTDLVKSGDLASARLLLRRAAEAGSASAALILGTTFDPIVIQQLGAIGVVPDVAQAHQWYEKAAALGSDAASQRLAKLPLTGQ